MAQYRHIIFGSRVYVCVNKYNAVIRKQTSGYGYEYNELFDFSLVMCPRDIMEISNYCSQLELAFDLKTHPNANMNISSHLIYQCL